MLPFKNKILFVGYGAVAQCALPILVKHIQVPAKNITVMDFENRKEALAAWIKRGVNFAHKRVTRENMGTLLGKYLGAGPGQAGTISQRRKQLDRKKRRDSRCVDKASRRSIAIRRKLESRARRVDASGEPSAQRGRRRNRNRRCSD